MISTLSNLFKIVEHNFCIGTGDTCDSCLSLPTWLKITNSLTDRRTLWGWEKADENNPVILVILNTKKDILIFRTK